MRSRTERRGAKRLGVSRPRRSHRLAQLRPSSSPPLVLRTPLLSPPLSLCLSLSLCFLIYHYYRRHRRYSPCGSQKAMSRSLLCRCTTSREFVIYEERQAPGSRMNESFSQVFLPLSSPHPLSLSPSPRPFRSLFIARLRHGPSL